MDEKPQLRQTRYELSLARRAYEAMRESESRDTFFPAWQDCLHRIERVWIKAERECSPFRAAFRKWQQPFKQLRDKDELLIYLRHARNVDQHGIQWTVAYSPFGVSITIPGNSTIELRKTKSGITIIGAKSVQETSPQFVLVSIVDRGVTYDPPRFHMGNDVTKSSPLGVADAGLTFYEAYVSSLSKAFPTEIGAIPTPHPDALRPRHPKRRSQ